MFVTISRGNIYVLVVFLLCSGEDGVDEPVAYDVNMDDDDDDDDDDSVGANVSNGTAKNDVMTTDDVGERHQGESVTSESSLRHDVDFTLSPPCAQRPSVPTTSSCPCSRTASPQPACDRASPPSCRATMSSPLSVDISMPASVPDTHSYSDKSLNMKR